MHTPVVDPNALHCNAGEINTLQGNLNWVSSREHSLTHPVWNGREEEFLPICNQAESDSANLDHMAEYCVRTGVDANQTLMMLVPEAYQNHPTLLRKYPEVISLACSVLSRLIYLSLRQGYHGYVIILVNDSMCMNSCSSAVAILLQMLCCV